MVCSASDRSCDARLEPANEEVCSPCLVKLMKSVFGPSNKRTFANMYITSGRVPGGMPRRLYWLPYLKLVTKTNWCTG